MPFALAFCCAFALAYLLVGFIVMVLIASAGAFWQLSRAHAWLIGAAIILAWPAAILIVPAAPGERRPR